MNYQLETFNTLKEIKYAKLNQKELNKANQDNVFFQKQYKSSKNKGRKREGVSRNQQ